MEMSNQIQPFAFGENMVRVLSDENGNPWFVAKDVCRILDIQNPADAVRKGLDDDERADIDIIYTSSNGVEQKRSVLAISESGLYALVFRSRKPEARAFSKWVRAEVLPALRKTGSYSMPGRDPSRREPMQEMLPPEALGLGPAMRQRLWQDALQTARLDGADSSAAREWFVYLCRLVAALPPAPQPARVKVRAFFHQCCRRAEGTRIRASELYDAFRRWHATQEGDLPSKKAFSVHMQEFARRFRSEGSWFADICLKQRDDRA